MVLEYDQITNENISLDNEFPVTFTVEFYMENDILHYVDVSYRVYPCIPTVLHRTCKFTFFVPLRWAWASSAAACSSGAVYTRGANRNDAVERRSICGPSDSLP